MIKKPLVLILTLCMVAVLGSTILYAAPNAIVEIIPNFAKVSIDGKIKDFKTVLFEDKIFVSIRDLAEDFGMTVVFDGKSSIVKINGFSEMKKATPSKFMIFMYILARSLQLAGLALFSQVAFFRLKKDHYFVKKYSTSQTSLRRLSHTAGASRMGVYFSAIGYFITIFAKENGLSTLVSVLLIIFLAALFWFLGLGAANSTTRAAINAPVEMN